MEAFEYKGEWWLPEEPGKKVAGILKSNLQQGIHLELIGSFRGFKEFSLNNVELIHGRTSKGKQVTLYECWWKHLSESSQSFSTSIYIVKYVFIGYHFKKAENISFDRLAIHYSHFNEWIGASGLKIKRRGFQVNYDQPDEINIKLNDLKISINSECAPQLKRNEVDLKEKFFIVIEPKEALHIETYEHDIFYFIQNFLNLGIDRAIYPLIVKGQTKVCWEELPNGAKIKPDIFVCRALINQPDLSEKLTPADMLFSFKEISNSFLNYLVNWFSKTEIIGNVYSLYSKSLYKKVLDFESNFLNFAQAIEAYHRFVYGKNVYFKQSIKRILNERLKEYDDVINVFIRDYNEFTESAVNTRNYLTHRNPDDKCKAKKGQGLFVISKQIGALIQICVLLELGLPKEQIKKSIKRSRNYRYLTEVKGLQ